MGLKNSELEQTGWTTITIQTWKGVIEVKRLFGVKNINYLRFFKGR